MTTNEATNELSPNDGFLFHEINRGEQEFFEPLRRALKKSEKESEILEDEGWVVDGKTFTLAITGLHNPHQYNRLREIEKQQPNSSPRRYGVAMVELCIQWDVNYCYNHSRSCCPETLGWATHVLAPDPIAEDLRSGILSSPTRYADHLFKLDGELTNRRSKNMRRYRGTNKEDEVVARSERIKSLIEHLRSGECIWDDERIISSGLPPLVTCYFDGTQLRPPKSEAQLPPSIVWIDQRHKQEVRKQVKHAVPENLAFEPIERPPKSGIKEEQIETNCNLLLNALIVVTEFSNLGYQAALHGKRVLYCTWRAKTRPLPLLLNDSGDKRFKEHVREAKNEEDVHKAISDVINGVWREAERVETTPADEIVQRIREAVMPQSAA